MSDTESRFIDSINMTEEEVQPFLTYLDNLRDSGATNTMGASSYITQTFDVSSSQARAILSYWMGTFITEGVSK